jgi:hypothetical protein
MADRYGEAFLELFVAKEAKIKHSHLSSNYITIICY